MALPKIIPALADLTQDVAGPVPVSLLYAWAAGDQDAATAGTLLDPYRIDGTVVSSDTSGLSRLTRKRDLLDVLAMISRPKQIIHAIGVGIGGRAIGTWVADNTQCFYPAAVDTALVVGAMAEAERRISASLPVSVGLCVHRGTFYDLGGGLFGEDADLVSALAEDDAGPGEMLVTPGVSNACPDFRFAPRTGLLTPDTGPVFRLETAPPMPDLETVDRRYPHPYPQPFFEALDALSTTADPEPVRKAIYAQHLRELVVLFVARARERETSAPALLDDLVENALLDALVLGLDGTAGHVAGLGGGLGILTFDDPAASIETAHALRRRFEANGRDAAGPDDQLVAFTAGCTCVRAASGFIHAGFPGHRSGGAGTRRARASRRSPLQRARDCRDLLRRARVRSRARARPAR